MKNACVSIKIKTIKKMSIILFCPVFFKAVNAVLLLGNNAAYIKQVKGAGKL